MKAEDVSEGQRVHYIGHEGAAPEDGIIKSISQRLVGYVRVVFHCANDWKNYMDYTGQLTDLDHLFAGWVNIHEEYQEKCQEE